MPVGRITSSVFSVIREVWPGGYRTGGDEVNDDQNMPFSRRIEHLCGGLPFVDSGDVGGGMVRPIEQIHKRYGFVQHRA